jgi:2-C-methyl-D-erythritol 4-phosphate cytidylyltransferase
MEGALGAGSASGGAERVWAIVVAAGEGRRFGRPKQFELLGGRRVLEWAVDAARSVAEAVVLVVPRPALGDPAWRAGADLVVAGGPSRSASVRAGLQVVPEDADVTLVHDAARPLASAALFRAVLGAVRAGADAAVPGVPVADTVKRVARGRVVATLDRSDLVAVQTPQAFRTSWLRRAHEGAPEASDDAGLVEAIGGTVAVVPGEARNLKLTTVEDLEVAQAWQAR